jgi:hypothetical protein
VVFLRLVERSEGCKDILEGCMGKDLKSSHKNLHSGNILIFYKEVIVTKIADLGITQN